MTYNKKSGSASPQVTCPAPAFNPGTAWCMARDAATTSPDADEAAPNAPEPLTVDVSEDRGCRLTLEDVHVVQLDARADKTSPTRSAAR